MTPDPFLSGYRLIDGDELNTVIGNPVWSVSGAIGATVGGTAANSQKIYFTLTEIVSSSGLGAGVTLPQALEGRVLFIRNSSAQNVTIYAEDSTIEGVPGDIGYIIGPGVGFLLTALTNNNWSVLNLSIISAFILPGVVGYVYSDGVTPIYGVPQLPVTALPLTNGQSRGALLNFTGTTGAGPGLTWLAVVENDLNANHNDSQDPITISYYDAFWPELQTAWTYVRGVLKAYYGWSDLTADARILAAQTYAYANR
jgi:hypothetical protein